MTMPGNHRPATDRGGRPADGAAPAWVAGRAVIVTGGGRGLGRQIAVSLGAAGAAVAVVARSGDEVAATAEAVTAAGGRALSFALDVTDAQAVRRMVTDVERLLGPVDLLVANAAVVTPLGPAWEADAEEWWRTLEINLRGPYLCAHAVLPAMTARGGGRIVNVVSQAGLQPVPFGSAYCTSKAALIRLTEALAIEAGPHGVSVFAIEPGWVTTAMTGYLTRSEAGRRWIPGLSRMDGTPAHVSPTRAADLVLALASGQADSLSGRYLTVFDDLDGLVRRADQIHDDDLQTMRLRA
jgi:NAD(P)-dependent dehydrogenase (short-subunit alcohol dehydrogenase family)